MSRRFTTRDLALLAVFAALAGGLEAVAGGVLHALHIPFTGLLMGCLLVLILLVGRRFVPRRGAVALMGGAIALVKLVSIGGETLSPTLAILAETLLVEAALLPPGRIRAARFALAGSLALLWPLAHTLLRQSLVLGSDLTAVYRGILLRLAGTLEVSPGTAVLLLGSLIPLHLVLGGIGGLAAWRLGGRARMRMGLAPEEPS